MRRGSGENARTQRTRSCARRQGAAAAATGVGGWVGGVGVGGVGGGEGDGVCGGGEGAGKRRGGRAMDGRGKGGTDKRTERHRGSEEERGGTRTVAEDGEVVMVVELLDIHLQCVCARVRASGRSHGGGAGRPVLHRRGRADGRPGRASLQGRNGRRAVQGRGEGAMRGMGGDGGRESQSQREAAGRRQGRGRARGTSGPRPIWKRQRAPVGYVNFLR